MSISPGIRDWIIDHDYKWLFVVSYVSLAVVLSIAISLFWLVVVVAVHLLLEIIRQYYQQPNVRLILLQALWEVKLDIALVLFALALSLYMEVALGILGIRSAAQLGGGVTQGAIRSGARIAVGQRVLRGILLSVDDLIHVLRALWRSAMRRNQKCAKRSENIDVNPLESNRDKASTPASTELPDTPDAVHSPHWGDWTGRWGLGDWLSIALGVSCVFLLLIAPFTTTTFYGMIETLRMELHPFPFNHNNN